ncbi:MAG TPA: RHS repeat-associated core domain-containing protein [Kofleriaceae bacterium]|jgi:RHS repeat-associated protein
MRTFFRALGSLAIALAGAHCAGDSNSETSQTSDALSYPTNVVVPMGGQYGSLPGSGAVQSDGSYHYTLPIDVPPGRRGMQPHLSLEYSSRAGNGLLGMGWQLAGMAKISPCAKTIALDGISAPVTYSSGDDLCLGAEHLVPASDGFRLESSDNSTRFVTSGNTIKMQLADGSSKTFSTTPAGVASPLTDYLLSNESDADGNTVDYVYEVVSSSEYYPLAITYTNTHDDTSGQRVIRFDYSGDTRADWIQAFYKGREFDIKHTLVGIDCYAPAPPALVSQLMWSYKLEYELTTATTGRSRLVSVEKVGAYGGTSEKRTFGWASLAFPGYPTSGLNLQMTGIPAVVGETVRALDLDDDGRDELLVEQGVGDIQMAHATTESTFADVTRLLSNTFFTLDDAVIGDLDGDGHTDLIAPVSPSNGALNYDEEFRLLTWQGDISTGGFVASTDFGPYYFKDWNGVVEGVPHSVNTLALADLDGDGLLDLVHGVHFQPPFIPDPQAPNEQPGEAGEQTLESYYPAFFAYNWRYAHNITVGGQAATFAAESDLQLTTDSYPGLFSPLAGDPHPTFTLEKGAGRQGLVFANRWSGYYRQLQQPCLATSGIGIQQGTDGTISTFTTDKSHPQTTFADVNGDGESDLVHYDVQSRQVCVWFGGAPAGTPSVCAPVAVSDTAVTAVETNICTGDLSGPNPPSTPSTEYTGPWHLVAFDMDGDGRDDVVLVHDDDVQNNVIAPESYRIAFTATHVLSVTPFFRGFVGVGDFDGRGMPDIVLDVGQPTLAVSRADTGAVDWMNVVGDATATASNTLETVGYQPYYQPTYTTWPTTFWGWQSYTATPVIKPTCTFPQHCIRDGFPVAVVHRIATGDQTGAFASEYYAYSDPREDRQGRGFLGFGAVDKYEDTAMRETVTEYERDKGSLLHPVVLRQTVTTPIIDEVPQPPSITTSGEPVPSFPAYPRGTTSRARISQSTFSYDSCGGTDAPKAEPWCMSGSHTDEFEETVSLAQIADGSVLPQFYAVNGMPTPSDPGATLLRTSIGSYVHDHYGNVTSSTEYVIGGTKQVTTSMYATPDLTKWIVNHPQTVITTDGCADATCVGTSDGTTTPAQHRQDFSWTGADLTQITVEPTAADPLKETIAFGYNSDGSVTSVTQSSATQSRASSYQYDTGERMFVVAHTNALGQTEQFLVHPGFGEIVGYADANNIQTTVQLDELGNRRAVIPAGRTGVHISYSARTEGSLLSGTITQLAGTDGSSRTLETDLVGHSLFDRHIGFAGISIVKGFVYDQLGRPYSESRPGWGTPGAASITTILDTLNRPASHIDAAGNTTQYTQSFASTAIVDPMGHLTFMFRDLDGRAMQSLQYSPTSGNALTTTYRYGNDHELSRVIDPQGNVVSTTYDLRGRQTSITTPDSGTTSMTYDTFGDVLSQIKGGATTTNTYDALGRVTAVASPDGWTSLAWDGPNGIGSVSSVSNQDGYQAMYYDANGHHYRDAYIVNSQLLYMSRTFDSSGRVTSLVYPNAAGQSVGLTVGYTYNPYGFLSSVGRTDASPVTYWQEQGSSLDDVPSSVLYGNGITGTRTYDAAGRLTDIKDGSVSEFKYTYNPDSRISERIDQTGRTDYYSYDSLHRLTEWQANPVASTTRSMFYAFDDLGNLSSEKLGSTTLVKYGYGVNAGPHAVTQVSNLGTLAYDVRGRQVSKPGRTVTYTEADLPKTISNEAGITTMKYDAAGSRIFKQEPDGDWTTSLGGVFERRNESGVVRDYYYVETPEGVSAQAGLNETTLARSLYYLHHDHNGSIAAVTNTDQSVARRFWFDPWGNRTDQNAVPLSTPPDTTILLGFDELHYDDDVDLVDQRGRAYDPTLRHFMSADPLVSDPFNGQAYNRYSYIGNDPVNLTDPSGFQWDGDDPSSIGQFDVPYSDQVNGTSTPNDGGFTSSNSSNQFTSGPLPEPPRPATNVPQHPSAATPSNAAGGSGYRHDHKPLPEGTAPMCAANGDYYGCEGVPRPHSSTDQLLEISDDVGELMDMVIGPASMPMTWIRKASRDYTQASRISATPGMDTVKSTGTQIAVDVALALTSVKAESAAAKLLAENRISGKLWEQMLKWAFEEKGLVVFSQVRYDTPAGARFMDLVLYEALDDGTLVYVDTIEAKVGKSWYNPLQRAKDYWLWDNGKIPKPVVVARTPRLPR